MIYSQQLETTANIPLENLIANNFGQGCVEISNVVSTINGSINNIDSYGSFAQGASDFPFEEGIILSTGSIQSAGNTQISETLDEGEDNWLTDSDLENALVVSETLNATSIQFEFLSFSNSISFDYILASEEYFGINPCDFSDSFAILIKKTGTIDDFINIAMVPGTSLAVSTSNIRDEIFGFCPASNEQFFEGYSVSDTNFNGRTTVLTASTPIQPNVSYTIKFAIADNEDEFYDSAVFIKANSPDSYVNLGEDITTCADSIILDGDIGNGTAIYSWYLNDSLLVSGTNPEFTATVSGTYRVDVSVNFGSSTCIISDEVIVNLATEQSAEPLEDFELCDDQLQDGKTEFDFTSKDTEVLSTLPASNYNISYHNSLAAAQAGTGVLPDIYENTTNPQIIYVRIEDIDNGCLSFSNFNLIVKPLPTVGAITDIVVCDKGEADGIVTIDLEPTTLEAKAGDDTLMVSYHLTLSDALDGTDQVNQPYTNTLPNETLFLNVRDPDSRCSSITQLNITVLEKPDIDLTTIHYLNACEALSVEYSTFDLNSIIPDVLQGLTGVDVSFHNNLSDAEDGLNEITNTSNYQNSTASFETIFLRVVDNAIGCPSIAPIQLHTNLANTGLNLDSNSVCDDASQDGIAIFDLEIVRDEILNGFNEFNLTFFETENDRDTNTNALDITIDYEISNNPQKLFLTTEINGCITNVEVDLTINPPIEIPVFGEFDFCDTDSDGFTQIALNTFNSIVSDGVDNPNVRYFINEVKALDNQDRINPNNYVNTSNPQLLYVRVTNTVTECFDVAPLIINVLPAPEANAPSEIIICDDDEDGFTFIDLSAKIPEIVSSTSNLDVTFHSNSSDAEADENAILLPESYNANTQIIFVRVENATTGCFSTVELPITVNTLPVFGDIANFENCETDGTVVSEFFFFQKDDDILNGQTNKDVLYFETAQDAIDRTNIIDKFDAYTNISIPQTIYVRVEAANDPLCFGVSEFQLAIDFLPIFNGPVDEFLCDDASNDGVVTINLDDKLNEITEGTDSNLDIAFYDNHENAVNQINPISGNYSNVNNPQVIFARINNNTNCFSIVDFIINVIPAPDVSPFSDIVVCDEDYDETVNFDITVAEIEITEVRLEDVEITYHLSETGAITDTDIITTPENFTNAFNPQTVYIKVNNILSNCNVVLPVELIVNTPPVINNLSVFNGCDIEGGFINLSEINASLNDASDNIEFSYYFTESDAIAKINALDTTYFYSSLSFILYARLENETTGCFATDAFELILNPLPEVTMPDDLKTCDDASNDNIAEFDFTTQDDIILGSQNPNEFSITYHESETDAETGSNPLDLIYTGQDMQTIFVRIENNLTSCFNSTQFNLQISEHPNTPSTITLCDEDYDGIISTDLTQIENQLFAAPNPVNTITYFESLEDLNSDINAIVAPNNYTNQTNPQPIFVKIFNTDFDCFTYVDFMVDVNLPPSINFLNTFNVCENEDSIANLLDFEQQLLIQTANVQVSYYASEIEAIGQINSLNTTYTYSSSLETLYARISFSTTQCFFIHEFDLLINPLPIANQPPNMESCDDDFDGLFNFDFTAQDIFILGSQNPNDFSITYHNTEANASEGINPLPLDYLSGNLEIINVRIENKMTGCFELTNFTTIINPRPQVDIPDQLVCLNDLPILVSANTNIPTDTYLWSTGETTPEIELTEMGTYSVTVTNQFNCFTLSTFEVLESEAASIDITETINFSDPNNVTVTISGIGNYLFQLNDLSPQVSNLFQNVPLGYNTITVYDLNGCGSVSKTILVMDAPKFMTPNGDNRFDTWHISGVENLPGTVIYIFNRNGKLIKTLSSSTPGWDGTFNGSTMPAADYWYVAHVKDGERSFEIKGHFALKL